MILPAVVPDVVQAFEAVGGVGETRLHDLVGESGYLWSHRVVQLDFPPKMEEFCLLFDRTLFIFVVRSLN